MRRMLSRRKFMSCGAGAAASALLGGCAHTGGISSPRRSSVPMPPGLETTGEQSLKAHAARAGLLYGCAVAPKLLSSDAAYTQTILDQCDILVAENAMKWAALRPAFGQFNFDQADALLRFAEQHQMKLRGHNLLWHEALPKWFAAEVNRSNARQVLVEHIQSVAGRYAGRMHSWDVVNEVVWMKDGRPDGLRTSPWLELIGDDYIELAFRTARLADPTALLAYNEFGIELDTDDNQQKRDAVLLLLRRLKARNVPIDAMGVQSHMRAVDMPGFTGAGLKKFMQDVRQLGMQVFLTEMDMADKGLSGDTAKVDAAVADGYAKYLGAALSDPAVTVVLTWGITDRYTWLSWNKEKKVAEPVRPLPFDRGYKATEAFYAIRGAFDERKAGRA